MRLQFLMAVLMVGALANRLSADLITYEFAGEFESTSVLFNAGDTFSGSYTFTTESDVVPHPSGNLMYQTIAINSIDMPETGWQVDVNSSVVGNFSVTGEFGNLSIGDNEGADRYLATLSGFGPELPLGLELQFFQISLSGEDMVSGNSPFQLPNLANATAGDGGRFFIIDPPSGCSQCLVTLTSLTVPEPTSALLFVVLGIGIAGRRQPYRKNIHFV